MDGCRITTTVRGPDGSDPVAFETRRIGATITVTRQGPTATWRFLLAGATSVASVANGSVEVARDGVMARPTRVRRVSPWNSPAGADTPTSPGRPEVNVLVRRGVLRAGTGAGAP